MENKNEYFDGFRLRTRLDTYSNGNTIEEISPGTGPRLRDKIRLESSEGDHHTPNPYILEADRMNFPVGTNEQFYQYDYGEPRSTKVTYTGCVSFGESSITLPNDVLTYNMALSKLNERVRGSLDISVSLAQSSQTVRMFKVINSAKRYALKADWRSIVNGVSGAWLEFTYGWKPLIQDVYTAAEELQRKADTLASDSFRGRASVTDTASGFINFQFYGPVNYSVPVSHQCEIKIRLSKSFDPTVSRWTSLNPASIIWETIPYSFVVDWFVNIGGFLRDTETALLYDSQFQDGYVTQSSRINSNYQVDKTRQTYRDRVRSTYSIKVRGSIERLRKQRTPLHSYPLPHRPRVTSDLSWHRALNAAALLGNLIKQAKK